MDGSIKVEKSHHLEIAFYENEKLILDKDYKTRKTEGKERLQWSYLVAKIHISDPTFSIEQINELFLSKVDDFLLIASLATSIRTACIGWEASKGKTSISYYRGSLTFPTGMKQEILDQGLIPKRDLQEFISHSYDAFLHYENKAVLRGAIYSLVPGNERSLETSFLSLFAGLEMLLLDYRRGKNLEFNIEPDLWKNVKQKIQKEFKKVCKENGGLEIAGNQRKNIYEKLDELNRISLRTVWEDFCQTYKVEVKDLWPLFTQDGIVGLSNIRNWLIHGEPIPEDCFGALMIACENLKWILERVIVTLLGWEVSRTEVDPQFLKRYADALLNDMSNEQKQITKIFEKGK